MFKKIISPVVNYIVAGGIILLKTKAIEQDIYNLNNIKPFDRQKIVNFIVYTTQNNYGIIYDKERR